MSTATAFAQFSARSVAYQPGNAYALAAAADICYEKPSKVRALAMDQWGMKRCDCISRKDSQCFVASNDQCVIIAMRGTEMDQLGDIWSDMQMDQVSAHGGKVHKGFYKAYRAIRTALREKLRVHRRKKQGIYIAGHSLGGALAVLAAMDLKSSRLPIKGVYTIGQPRVGDDAFVAACKRQIGDRHYRFVHKDDKVPSVPAKEIKIAGHSLLRYGHSGQQIYIASRDRLTLDYRRSKNIINKAASLTKAMQGHSSETYVKAIGKNTDMNPFTDGVTIKEKAMVTGKDVKRVAKQAGKSVSKTASKAGKAVGKTASKAAKDVKKTASKAGKAVGKTASKAAKDVKKTANKAGKTVSRTADKAGKSVKKTANKAGRSVKKTANKAGKTVGRTASKTAKDVKKTAGKAGKTVKRTANKAAKDVKKTAKRGSRTVGRTAKNVGRSIGRLFR